MSGAGHDGARRPSRVTLHMAASLDGFIARPDGRVDWMETADEYSDGAVLQPDEIAAFLRTIDCYVMGARTYEVALGFERAGHGWAYGSTPTVVLTTRDLPRTRDTVECYDGDLPPLFERLRAAHRSIWVVGGAQTCSDCLRLGLADEVRYSIVPVLIGGGIPFFGALDADVPLHLVGTRAYRNGMVELHYEVRR